MSMERVIAKKLKQWAGATIAHDTVFLIPEGAPGHRPEFTMYYPADLKRAFDLGLLHKQTLLDGQEIFVANEG
jgi:hypothetical protein